MTTITNPKTVRANAGDPLAESPAFKKPRLRWRRKSTLIAYAFLAPWIIGLAVFYLGPVATSAVLSFTDYNIISPAEFTGFDNYEKMITDGEFVQALKVTLYYTAFFLLMYVVLSLFVAILANRPGRGTALFRLIVFLPSLIPLFAAAVLWGWIFNTDFGLINYLLEEVGLPRQGFFQDPGQALPLVGMLTFWSIGSAFLVYLSGLQSIPVHLYEAITVDGASAARRFWHITLPMLSPVILFNLIIGIVLSFQVFDIAWVLTNGGPANRTLFWVLLIFRRAFQDFEMGYASALSWVLFIVVAGVTGLIFRTSRWWVHYEGRAQ